MNNKVAVGKIDFEILARYAQKPQVDTPGEALFWNDPYIAQQMLKAHIDPNTDAASRKPETIERSVAWMIDQLKLGRGSRFLDLGCGPGLYTLRLARRGLDVTGIDFSAGSLEYARLQARQENLSIQYILQDYLTLDLEGEFDAACLIYFDLGVFSRANRDQLLPKIFRALKPGGHFVFDVVTQYSRPGMPERMECEICPSGGFWRPGAHMVISQFFLYPEEKAHLDHYLIIDDSGSLVVYNVWEHHFTVEMLQSELKAAGFSALQFWSDLTGTPYAERAGSIGVIATK
jgi:SAM-dependent methyltransferase